MPAVFEWPTVPPRPPVASAFWRAARLHCPACGGGPVFLSWLRIGPACPSCGLNFTRGERGYWLGAYFVNLMAVEAIFAVMTARLRQSTGRLREAERRATLGDVARQVNHDIKNGLAPIRHGSSFPPGGHGSSSARRLRPAWDPILSGWIAAR